MQAQQELEDVSFEKDDAMAAMEKLRSVIQIVQVDMADAQEAADRYTTIRLSCCFPWLLITANSLVASCFILSISHKLVGHVN